MDSASVIISISFAIALVVVVVVCLEVLLRKQSALERTSGGSTLVGADQHGAAAIGSWKLSPEVIAQLDPDFSATHWTEMQAQSSKKTEATFKQISSVDQREVRCLTDFEGSEFSVVRGERRTTDQPDGQASRILCFGGSTTFCLEVSDSRTWPSYLQRLVNSSSQNSWRVHNCGIPGVPGLDRIAAFRHLSKPQPGDIAVFLFGDNDAGWVQWYPKPGLVQHQLPRFLRKLKFESKRGIHLAGWLYDAVAPIFLKKVAIKTARFTIKSAEEAMTWADKSGVEVFFFLQPNIFTRANPNERDREIIKATAHHLVVMLRSAYRQYEKWAETNSRVLVATQLFDSETVSPYMGDWAHVNSPGNKLIAEMVFKELNTRALRSSGHPGGNSE